MQRSKHESAGADGAKQRETQYYYKYSTDGDYVMRKVSQYRSRLCEKSKAASRKNNASKAFRHRTSFGRASSSR